MFTAIAIIIVMLAVNVLMFFSVRRAAIRVDYTLRRLFLQKMSLEDATVLENSAVAHEKEASEKQAAAEPVIKQILLSTPDNVRQVSYKSGSLRDDYKVIKKIGEYTPEVALDKAKKQAGPSAVGESNGRYTNILKTFNFDTVFSLSSLDSGKQEELLRNNLPKDHIEVLDRYITEKTGQFDAVDFYSYVKQMAEVYDSGFTVRTGNKEDDGKVLSDGTKLVYDEQIFEGSQVIYENKLYDYSL